MAVAKNALGPQSAVSVLLGNGDGTFQPYVNYSVNMSPYEVITGDFNGDGKIDLAVSSNGNTLSILLGNGDGTFQPQTQYSTGEDDISVTAADFNRDGALDLATVNGSDSTFSVFLQNFVPVVTFSPTALAFIGQAVGTTSSAQTVTLTNSGNATLDVTSIAINGTNADDFAETNACPATLPPATNCAISVAFTPSAEGTRSASLSVTDNAAGSPQSVSLRGTGDAAVVTLSPTSLSFGAQPLGTTSAAQTVTLINTGNETLSITGLTVSAGFRKASQTCSQTLAAGAACTVQIEFTPARGGPITGTVTVTDNAPGSPQTVSLTGVGTAAELSTSALKFGDVQIHTSSTQTVTLTNVGKAAFSIGGIAITGTRAAAFSQTNTCPPSLGASASCSIMVTFTPKAVLSYSDTLQIVDGGGGSPQTVSLSGTGIQ